jgi:hypothetical protein
MPICYLSNREIFRLDLIETSVYREKVRVGQNNLIKQKQRFF